MTRIAVGLAFLHLAFDTKNGKIYETVTSVTRKQPVLFGRIIRESLSSWIRVEDEKRAKGKRAVEEEIPASKSQKIGRLLAAIFKPDEAVDKSAWAELAVEYLVVAHHPEIGEDAQVSWISLVQGVGLDPATVLFDHRENVLTLLWKNADVPLRVRLTRRVLTDLLLTSGCSFC